jgi:hypothetical protein
MSTSTGDAKKYAIDGEVREGGDEYLLRRLESQKDQCLAMGNLDYQI